MTTPISRLELALAGRSEFLKEIFSAIFGPSKEDEEQRKLEEQKSNPEFAMKQLIAFVGRRQQQDGQHRPKRAKRKSK
jgi:hypothetical protein